MPPRDKDLRRHQAPGQVTAHFEASYHQQYISPLPPAEELAKLETLHPGITAKILARWEKQSDHRMALEHLAVKGENFRANAGVFCATLISICFLAGGVWLGLHGQAIPGATIAGVPLVGGVGIFLNESQKRREERRQKAELMAGELVQNPSAPLGPSTLPVPSPAAFRGGCRLF